MSIKIKNAPTTTVKSTLKVPVGNVGDNNAHTITLSDLKTWMGSTGSGGGGGWRWAEVIDKPNLIQVGELKTINGQTIVGTGDMTVSAVEIDWDRVNNRPTKLSDFTNDENFVTSATLSSDYQAKLVNGGNIKSLNGKSILGEGNMTLPEAKSGNGINVADNGTVNITYIEYTHKVETKSPTLEALVGNSFNRVVYSSDETEPLAELTVTAMKKMVETDTCFLIFMASSETVLSLPRNVTKTGGFPVKCIDGLNVIMFNSYMVEGQEYWYATMINGGGGAAESVAWNDITGKPTFATVATSGSYNDLSSKPTIPTVNNVAIDFYQGGTLVDSITTNQSTASAIYLNDGKVYTAGDGMSLGGNDNTVINRTKTTINNANANVVIDEVASNAIYNLTSSSFASLTLTSVPNFDLETVIYFNYDKGTAPTFSFPNDCSVYGDFANLPIGRHTIVIQNKVIGLASGGVDWDNVTDKPYGIQVMSVYPTINTVSTSTATISDLMPNEIYVFNDTSTITISSMTDCLDNTKNWIPARIYINNSDQNNKLNYTINFPQTMKMCGWGWKNSMSASIGPEDTLCVEIINGYVRIFG